MEITNIRHSKRLKDHYEYSCPKCKRLIGGVTIKAVQHNIKMHNHYCKKEVINEMKIQGVTFNEKEASENLSKILKEQNEKEKRKEQIDKE